MGMRDNTWDMDPAMHRNTLQEITRPCSQVEDALAYMARLLDQLRVQPSGLALIHDRPPQPELIPVPVSGVVIGRAVDVGYRAADDTSDGTLSSRHFRVFEHEGHVWAEDLGSTNRTWIGNVEITRRILRTGDIIRAGKQRFVFIDAR
jgi:hypothetical protein